MWVRVISRALALPLIPLGNEVDILMLSVTMIREVLEMSSDLETFGGSQFWIGYEKGVAWWKWEIGINLGGAICFLPPQHILSRHACIHVVRDAKCHDPE